MLIRFGHEIVASILRGGYEGDLWGTEGGGVALHTDPRDRGSAAWSYQAHVVAWLALDLLFDQPVLLQGQYLAFFESDAVFHTFFAQVGYRL